MSYPESKRLNGFTSVDNSWSPSCNLDEYLLVEILVRLPLESILEFRVGTMILSSAGVITFFHEKAIFRKSNSSSRYVIRGSGVYGPPHHIQHQLTYPRTGRRRCECLDLYKELIPYPEAWSWQKSIVQKRAALMVNGEDHSDTVIVLQHPPVYTLGTGSTEEFLKFDVNNAPFDIYRVERGGEVTYHGPGQIVLYPIINLRYHKTDLHWYLRSLEEVVLRVLSNTFSIEGSRVEGLTGVWVGNQKIAAIGIKVSRWITFHGLALNVTTDLTPFEQIVPCGIRDRQVGSLSNLLGISTHGRIEYVHKLMDMTHASLLKEFAEVFGFNLEFTSNLYSLQEQSTHS